MERRERDYEISLSKKNVEQVDLATEDRKLHLESILEDKGGGQYFYAN